MKNQKFIKILLSLFLGFILISPVALARNLQDAFAVPSTAQGGLDRTNSPISEVATKAGYETSTTFNGMIGQVITVVLSVLGIIFLILLVYAGTLWMTAAGNEQQITKARSMITTAIIGLVIVLSAYSISFFVLSALQEGSLNTAN